MVMGFMRLLASTTFAMNLNGGKVEIKDVGNTTHPGLGTFVMGPSVLKDHICLVD
jgi:hypothetical protein